MELRFHCIRCKDGFVTEKWEMVKTHRGQRGSIWSAKTECPKCSTKTMKFMSRKERRLARDETLQ